MNNYFGLSNKYNRYSKTKRKKIIIMILAFFLIILIFSFKKSMNLYISEGLKKDLSYRLLFVDQDGSYEQSSIINDILNIRHVDDVFLNDYYLNVLSLKQIDEKNFINNSFYLIGINEKNSPKIKYGKFFSNENEIICPINFYPDSNIENSNNIKRTSIINTKKYLNSIFNASYNIYDKDFNATEVEIKLKLVGVYENNPSYIDENICYAPRSLIKKIYDESYQNIDFTDTYSSINVLVDDSNNINYVMEELSNKNYNVTMAVSLNNTLIDMINIGSYIVSIFVLIIGITIINFINKSNISEKQKEISILRCVGFPKKAIKKMLYIENIFIGILSLLISCGITILMYLGLKIIVFYNPLIFQKIPISYSGSSIFVSIIVLLITIIASNKFLEKKLFSKSIIKASKDFI